MFLIMSDEEEAGVAMEEGERGQDEDVEEEEGAREAMKSDPGEDEDEDGGSRRRTRGSFGIKVPRKEWPNVKQRKYRKRGRRGRPTKRVGNLDGLMRIMSTFSPRLLPRRRTRTKRMRTTWRKWRTTRLRNRRSTSTTWTR